MIDEEFQTVLAVLAEHSEAPGFEEAFGALMVMYASHLRLEILYNRLGPVAEPDPVLREAIQRMKEGLEGR